MGINLNTTQVNSEIPTLSLDDVICRYALSNRAEGKSDKTTIWYSEMLGAFTRYLAERNEAGDFSSFTISAVRQYILYLRDKPRFGCNPSAATQVRTLSPRTIQCHVRALKAFSSWLHVEGYTEENRLQNLKLPKAPTLLIEPLTPEEINEIISCIDRKSPIGIRNHAIVVTLFDTGLRASELAGIKLTDLNLEGGFLKVMGKGSKERTVPIGRYVRMILLNYIENIRSRRSSPDYVFLSPGEKPLTANTLKLFFSRLAKKSGVGRLHAHLCRHTFAINYLLNGGDIFSLKEILGHTTLEMVNHYLHFTSSQITEQHHKYSPMDKLQRERNTAEDN